MFEQEVLLSGRRRSVDVGGLALALGNQGLGHGWGGWEEREKGEIRYAELLSGMYESTNTHIALNDHPLQCPPLPIAHHIRCRLIKSLDSWKFEPHKLPDEEVLSCTLILFEVLFRIEGLQEDVGVSLSQISNFLRHLRQIYRTQNSYHNFQHALDVLQATHTFLCAAGMVPTVSILSGSDDRIWRPDRRDGTALVSCLNNHDLFTLYIAAIGHDVGHPGFTNMFMKNAKTPLSLVYDDKSPLEQMHYALLLQIMRHHGLGDLLDRPISGTNRRKLLWETVLATDMNVHSKFMQDFEKLVNGGPVPICAQKILICQALIKCADISNPSRPLPVSQHWATALAEEWSSQALLEKHCHLPSTVQSSNTPLTRANSQIWFINTYAKPLLELTTKAIPQMQKFAKRCASNLKIWQDRSSRLVVTPSVPLNEASHPTLQLPSDFSNAFPLTLPPQLLTPQDEQGLSQWPSIADIRADYTSPASEGSSEKHMSDVGDPERPVILPSITTTFSASVLPVSPTESLGSSRLSPNSEISCSLPRPSSAGSTSSASTSETTTAIRAAYEASVRKRKSFHRNSWNTSPLGSTLSLSSASYSCNIAPGVASDHGITTTRFGGTDEVPRLARIAIVTTFKPAALDVKSRMAS